MIDRWLAIYDDDRLRFLSLARRAAAADAILLAEVQGSVKPSEPLRWFEVTDMGKVQEEELRQSLLLEGYERWRDADTDTVMVEYAIRFGKVVTPIVKDVPPFYLINGTRESIYQLRLRVKDKYLDFWNTAPRDQIVQTLRDSGDTVQEV